MNWLLLRRRGGARGLYKAASLALVLCAAAVTSASAQSAQDPILARAQILITGGGISINPPTQVVPRNTATIVETILAVPGDQGGADLADLASAFPADAVVMAELSGPSLGSVVTLAAKPGEPFQIQPLAIAGLHFLSNIRLVSNGTTLLAASPATVTLEVIDKLLVSQVSSRALTADEIRDRGIVVDQTNYQVVSFSAAFGFQNRNVTIDFPMIVPARSDAALAPAAPPLQLPALQPAVAPAPAIDLPRLVQAFGTANVGVSGLLLKVEDEDVERAFNIPPLPGVIVIPGNIAYLNQFFSVMLLVSNVAPGNSTLTVRDVRAEIILPPGSDTVAGSGDDPLRMARVGSPPVEQPRVLAVTQAGPDGKLGTADDLLTIGPQQSGNSEHLVEGLREGTHTIEMKITATLDGLPIGPVPVSGRVLGTVEVRNPTFALTLSHPATVSAGEEYNLLVTVTNTSRTPANFASLNLLPRSISGATLLTNATVQIDTIAPGDSETVSFRLLSHTTGTVTATSFSSEGVPGKFELTTAVGANGIPMSPNTLVLPAATDALPDALKNAAVGFLGQAFALATAPVTPDGLLPLGQQMVYERATILAQAGQRLGLQEAVAQVVRDLLLDWAGNDFSRIPERFDAGDIASVDRTQADFRAIDVLFRASRRGQDVTNAIGQILGAELQSAGYTSFLDAWSAGSASRPPQITALASAAFPIAVELIDPQGQHLGAAAAGAPASRDVPYGAFAPLTTGSGSAGQLAVVANPQSGMYEAAVSAGTAGTLDFGLVVPDITGLRRLTYSGVALLSGARARVRFMVGGPNSYALEIDDNGDGTIDRTVGPTASAPTVDAGPALVGAVQVVTGKPDLSRFGQLVAVVFSEEISAASSQSGLDPAQLTHYQVDANQVLGAALQPGGRVVLLSLRDGVGPFIPRSVTVSGIEDRLGHPMVPSPTTRPIVPADLQDGGSIRGRVLKGNGTPVPRAQIRLAQHIGTEDIQIAVKNADSDGHYSFDFILAAPTRLDAIDPDSGERGDVNTSIRQNGQALDLDIVLLGTGTVAGRALSPARAPLAGAVVRITSLTRIGEVFAAVTSDSGAFVIAGVPVGNVTIEAVHTATNARTLVAGTVPAAGAVVVQDLTLIPLVQAATLTGSVIGQVFRSDGVTPAAGIPVYTDRGGLATTDASGAYRIDLLPIGQVSVRAIDQARFEQATVVTTVVASSPVTANLRLFGGFATVRGVVLDAGGLPVQGASVGGGPSLVQTSATGEFELTGIPLGQRTITAVEQTTQSAGSATVSLNVPDEVTRVQIVLEAHGSIAGRVFDSHGQAVAGLKVFLLGGRNLAAITDDSGGYRFDNIPIGVYQISAFLSDFSDGNIVSTRLAFRGQIQTTNVTFRGKGTVTGTVLAANGVTPLGARVGLSELKVKVGQLKPAENLECVGDVQVGDLTVEMPKCEPVGIAFGMEAVTRIADNDVASGRFVFDDVLVGPVTVQAANALSPIIITAGGDIPAPDATLDLRLQLAATSTVTGTVLRPDGRPAGADVVVALGNRNVVTDANGRFTHFEVPPGAFDLTASGVADTAGLLGQSHGAVAPGVTTDVPIRLLGRGSVSVEVRGVNGPVADARVRVRDGAFPYDEREGFTDAQGKVRFSGGDVLSEGPFSASAEAAGVAGFASGAVVRDAETDIVIQVPDAAGTVEGRFLNPAGTAGIPNAQIRLSSAGGDAFATTDGDGHFQFDGVRLGGVTLEGFDPTTARRGRATNALAANGQSITVNVLEIPQGTVTGLVRLSTDHTAVAAAEVTLSVNSTFGGQFSTTTALDGTFSFPGVSAGTFTVSARDGTTSFTGGATGSLTTEGDTPAVVVDLQVPSRGRVQGTVTTSAGAPALGASVALGDRHTTVANDGSYFFDNVPLGIVTVVASASAGPDGGVASNSLAYSGEILTVDVRFTGTGSISGTVRSGGSAVAFATVTLTTRNRSGRAFGATSQTGSDGAFSFPVVPVGEVSVTAVQTATGLAGTASGTIGTPGEVTTLDVALQPSGSIHGIVHRESSSIPAAGLAIEVTGASHRFGSTGQDGTFSFPDMALGSYQVAFSDPTGDGIARALAELDTPGEALDLGDIVLDTSPPAVLSITPSDGAALVPVTTSVAVHFSERIDPATVSGSTLLVGTSAGALAGAWTLSADGATAVFVPASRFSDFTQVSVKVTTGVRDTVGRALPAPVLAGFQTADSLPPVVVSVVPAASSTGVRPDSAIRVAYSEAINPAAFAGPAITVRIAGAPIPGSVTPILNNTAVVFTPTAGLQPNARYDVAALPAADVFGNMQAQGVAFSFTTIDTIAPVIQQLNSSASSVIEGSVVTVSAQLASPGDVASVAFLVNGSPAGADTSAPFEISIPITTALAPAFTVEARATDASGNVSGPATLTMAVQSDTPPSATILSPVDGGQVDTGSTLTLRVRATDDRGISRIAYQTSGQITTAGGANPNPPSTTAESTFLIPVPAGTAPGPMVLRAAATDVGGVSSPTTSVSITLADATAPSVQILSPAAGVAVTAGRNATILASAADNGTLASMVLDTSGVVSLTQTQTVSSSSAQATFTVPIPSSATEQDVLNIVVRSRDAAGNESVAAQRTFAVLVPDTTRPVAVLATASGSLRVLAGETVPLRAHVTDNVGVTSIAFHTDGAVTTGGTVTISPPLATGTAAFSIDVPASVPNGAAINVHVSASDAAGNVSDDSSLTLSVGDTAPPTIQIVAPAEGTPTTQGGTVTMSVHATDDTAVRRVMFTAGGAFTASSTQDVAPPAASADATFSVTLPSSTAAGILTITAQAVDTAGNLSPVVTRTLTVTDTVAPQVIVAAPSAGASIDPRTPLHVTVEATDETGVSQITFSASGAASASETRDVTPPSTARSETFTVDFASPPPAGGSLDIRASARDAAGNIRSAIVVTAHVLDVVPPAVAAIAPANGAVDVDPQTLVRIEFNEAMDAATLTSATLALLRGGSPEPVAIAISGDGRTVTLTPQSRPLPFDAAFTVTVGAAAADLAGNALGVARSFTFRTARPDTTSPRVVSTSPADQSIDVSLASPIDVTFNEPVDPLSVTAESFHVSSGGSTVSGTFAFLDGSARARFVPAAALPADRTIVVELTSAIHDAAGNALADANGQPLTGPIRVTFATGRFSITNPGIGASVTENTPLVLEARASASLGVASVLFTVNGEALPAVSTVPFAVTFAVGAAANTPALTITASARNAQGQEIAADTRTVDVVVGLRVTPSLTGVPLGGASTVRFSLTSAAVKDVPITLSAGDASIISFTTNPVAIAAGQAFVDVVVSGLAPGNTAITGTSAHGAASAIVSVSQMAAGATLNAVGASGGVSVLTPPSSGVVVTAPAHQNTVRVGILDVASQAATAISITSTNPEVATATAGSIPAGQQAVDLVVTSGQAGVATLVIRAGDAVRIVTIIVTGSTATAVPSVLARPAGVVTLVPPSAGHILTKPDTQSILSVPVLAAPAPVDTPVTIESSNPEIATASSAPIAHGSVSAQITIAGHASGVAIIVIRAGGELRALTVFVGSVPQQFSPMVLARPAGVSVITSRGGRIYAPVDAQATLIVPMLSVGATSDTPVVVTSTDTEVVTAMAAEVRAGELVSSLTLISGRAGRATLTLEAGGVRLALDVVVGAAPAAADALVASAPVGASVVAAPSAGRVIARSGLVSAPTLTVPLLAAPAGGSVAVVVTTDDPTIASVGTGSSVTLSVTPGQQTLDLPLSIPGKTGATVVRFTFEGEQRELLVVVGDPATIKVPALTAPAIGVEISR